MTLVDLSEHAAETNDRQASFATEYSRFLRLYRSANQ